MNFVIYRAHDLTNLKKLAAILFTTLLLLNVAGYYGLFLGLKYKHKTEMIKKLDAGEYSNLEPIIIKLPLSIPYASDSRDFERVDGEFEYQGEFYRLVKQRLSQDTLFLVCVKDHKRKQLDLAVTHYVKTFSDTTSDEHSGSRSLSTFSKDYLNHTFAITKLSFGWECDLIKFSSIVAFISSFYPSVLLPPDII